MTRQEVIKIMSVIEKAYPKFNYVSGEDFEAIMLWQEMLSDVDYPLANAVVKQHISRNKFQPTIADIRGGVAEITAPKTQLTSDQAWGEIIRAIKRHGIYQEAEALASMSPITARIAKNMNWKETCMSENQMADRAHFIKMFEAKQQRAKQQAMLPEGLAKDIALEQQKHQCEIEGPVNVFAGFIEKKEGEDETI